MIIGDFFTLTELTRTSTGLPNRPHEQELVNLTRLVALVLDPLRLRTGRLDPTSGYRSAAVNKAVGGAENSFHRYGCAVDIVSEIYPPSSLFGIIRELHLQVDKAILESVGGKNWVHIQLQPAGTPNRNQFLVAEEKNGKITYREA